MSYMSQILSATHVEHGTYISDCIVILVVLVAIPTHVIAGSIAVVIIYHYKY